MESLTILENAAGDYAAKYGNENALTRINAFKAGAAWQKDEYVDLIIAVQSFIEHGNAEQWSIDHHKEVLSNLLKPLQD